MIVDGPPDPAAQADICIVGSGPVGLSLALRCAAQGKRVMVIEAGYGFQTGRTVPAPPIEFVNASHAGPDVAMMRSVGGTSHLWGGRCVAFDDIDFRERPYVPHSGWPLAHHALQAHYPDALRFLGCTPPAHTQVSMTDGEPVLLDRTEFWSQNGNVADAHDAAIRSSGNLMLHTGCQARRVLIDATSDGIRGVEVEHEGRCQAARAHAYVLAAGGLENTRLLMVSRRHMPQLFGGEGGPLGRFYCGHLTGHLAGIVFADPQFARRLWFQRTKGGGIHRQRLACADAIQEEMALLNTAFWLDSYSISDPTHGSGLLSGLYLALWGMRLYPRVSHGQAPRHEGGTACHMANLRNGFDPRAAVALGRQLAARRRDGSAFALFNPAGRYLLRYHAEHAPNPESRVELATEGPEAGPGLRVDLRFSAADTGSVVRSHARIDAWLRANGIGQLDYHVEAGARDAYVAGQALDGYHQIGLTRMSADRSCGIVDANCRVHDLSNLYVAGSSVFPTAGQANPTLPAVALALRLADHLSAS